MKKFLLAALVVLGINYIKNKEINDIREYYSVDDEE